MGRLETNSFADNRPIALPLMSELTTLLNLLETLLANSPIGFCFFDEALRFVCVNQPFSGCSTTGLLDDNVAISNYLLELAGCGSAA